MEQYFGDVWLVRLVLQRAMAALYLIAFVVVLRQFKPLLGERGLLPVPAFLKRVRFIEAPSLFCWRYSDRLLQCVAWTGVALSAIALLGLSERGPIWLSITVWLVLYFLYLSVVNVGQKFYGFGWESMLLEAGFFTTFMGPAWVTPSVIPVLALRWMLFRTELGAGLIKIRHDPCWRDLTCLFYHYETQPLPNPLSWYFHHLPKSLHRFSVLFSHFAQIVAPFGLFAPQPVSAIAGGLLMFHQALLIMSGNYSWLNWLTVALGLSAFSDALFWHVLPLAIPHTVAAPIWFSVLLYLLAAATVVLSIQPAANLTSKNQRMNFSYNPFHLVGTYGAFGSVTRKRYEVVIEGTEEPIITPQTQWREYAFKAKPGDPHRTPPQIAPYHLRLDWLMWFLPFSVMVSDSGILVPGFEVWFMRFLQKLLEGDPGILRLIKHNPFPNGRPLFVRALYYEYRYTDWQEKRQTGAWWSRRLIDVYLPPVSIAHLRRL
jgi:Lipase maturation factor